MKITPERRRRARKELVFLLGLLIFFLTDALLVFRWVALPLFPKLLPESPSITSFLLVLILEVGSFFIGGVIGAYCWAIMLIFFFSPEDYRDIVMEGNIKFRPTSLSIPVLSLLFTALDRLLLEPLLNWKIQRDRDK